MKPTLRLLLGLLLLVSMLGAGSTAQEATPEATDSTMDSDEIQIIEADFDGPRAFVRFLHLAASSENIDIYVDEALSDSVNLAFTESGNWLVLPAGRHTFAIRRAGDTGEEAITSFDLTLSENEPLMIAIVDGQEAPAVLLIRDNYEDVAPGVGTLNFVNALSGDTGVNFLRDNVVFVSAVNPASGDISEVNNSIDVDAASYTFSATYSGTDEPVDVEALELDVRDEDNYLIVLAGTAEAAQLLFFETSQADIKIMRGEMEAPGTVLDALRAKGYEDFVTMLEEAGLAESLRGEGPYTIFVPADFLMDELAASGEDMNAVLQNYIVEGDVRSSDVLEAEEDITMMGGETYQLSTSGNSMTIGNAELIDVNIVATNGTIHIINNLLSDYSFPEGTPEATPEGTQEANG
jgi:hypothetical protein